ncbi:MAG: nucleotide pyrophosphohydrolase [Dermatophilus congolensis]|nr:nucleotide pyrophosphohydrolase [Dermatophilus congolensis]
MTDELARLTAEIRSFTDERGWHRFHDPKSLILALTGEVGELAELFQWIPADEAVKEFAAPARKQRVAEELSDVLIYLLQLADVLDVDLLLAATAKLEAAAARYPATDGERTAAPVKP